MMSTQVVTGAVAVRADAGPQTFQFQEQLLAIQPCKVTIGVHAAVS